MTTKRFRTSLAQYRHELSQTMRYHDLLYATRLQLGTQELITKDLLERKKKLEKEVRLYRRLNWYQLVFMFSILAAIIYNRGL